MARNGSPEMSPAGAQFVVPPDDIVFGCTPGMLAVRQQLEKECSTTMVLLAEGEGGTDKETRARCVPLRAPWRSGPFIKFSFAAIPGGLLENELFGYPA